MLNSPGVLGEVLEMKKGEEFSWKIAERGEFVLYRPNKKKSRVVQLKKEKSSDDK